MEQKEFQARVLAIMDRYLDELIVQKERADKIIQANKNETDPDLIREIPDFTDRAWIKLRSEGVLPRSRESKPFQPRKDGAKRPIPNVCLKVPTGGGKTYLATECLSRIMGKWIQSNTGFVLWIVPNEAIYTQTKKALSDRTHPYRQILDRVSANKVKLLDKTDGLDKRDVESNLCVLLLMLQSANRGETKENLKVYMERGNIHGFFPNEVDYPAHDALKQKVPNLCVNQGGGSIGGIIQDSLGNALRIIRPVVVVDEGHRAFSKLALKTLDDLNPSFLLELSATPKDREKDIPPVFTNWLVDVQGTDLAAENMIKLPINVLVRGGQDWHETLRKAYEKLNDLGSEADQLRANANRYIRPICLFQVERTGEDQRESGKIHAKDVREYLLTLGVREEEIAIKTSEQNDLKNPENQDLLSQTNQIRFIITKQALQEGWDCPFAYVLCALAPIANQNALTQLVGRILRQPDTIKTGMQTLDECHVICHHDTTEHVINAIKKGLENEGLADIGEGGIVDLSSNGGNTQAAGQEELYTRRDKNKNLQIFLPQVNWVEGGVVRTLDYERDILFNIDWGKIGLGNLMVDLADPRGPQIDQVISIGLRDAADPDDVIDIQELQRSNVQERFDPVYATRSLSQTVPNPWVARGIIEKLLIGLRKKGMDDKRIGMHSNLIIGELEKHLVEERDKLAEKFFKQEVKNGRIQFRLRTDSHNWKFPKAYKTAPPDSNRQLYRADGKIVENSLFAPVYEEDFNSLEKYVAGYLDSDSALSWWHRNVVKRHYHVQGWQKEKVYPDFIFAKQTENGHEHLFVLETKGDQLQNLNTEYKSRLLDLCTDAYKFENVKTMGKLELVFDENTTVTCKLIQEQSVINDLNKLLS